MHYVFQNQDYSNASLCDENAYPELFSFLSNLPTKNIDTQDTLEASTIPKDTQVFPTPPSPVQTFCTAHGFSDLIAMTADDIHSRARDTAVKYVHQPNVLIAAAVYIACRHIGDPRTYKDIWTCAQISHRKLVNAVGYLDTFLAAEDRNELEEGEEKGKGKEEANKPRDDKGLFTHADLLYLYFSPLDLHPTVQAVCLDLSRRVAHYQLDTKKSPAAVASAIIFFICKLFDIPMSVYELSVLSGVSQWMIRNMFEAFRSEAGWRMLVDSRWLVDGTGSLERVLAWKPRKLGAKESRVA